MNKEIEKDRQTQSLVQGGSYTTFPQAFGEQISNLNKIKTAVNGYKGMSEKTMASHNQYKTWLPKLADPVLNINVSFSRKTDFQKIRSFLEMAK